MQSSNQTPESYLKVLLWQLECSKQKMIVYCKHYNQILCIYQWALPFHLHIIYTVFKKHKITFIIFLAFLTI